MLAVGGTTAAGRAWQLAIVLDERRAASPLALTLAVRGGVMLALADSISAPLFPANRRAGSRTSQINV